MDVPTNWAFVKALLQHADVAMYEAKAAGRDAARLATPGSGWP